MVRTERQSPPATVAASMASQLPIDIIHCLTIAVSELPGPSCTSTLTSLCLTSRSWLEPAQQALFATPFFPATRDGFKPTFGTYVRMQAFHEAISSRSELALSVRSLPLGTWMNRTKSEALIDRRLVSQLAISILVLCTNLTTLDFPGVTPSDSSQLFLALTKLNKIRGFSYGDGVAGEEPWIINYNPDIRAVWGTAPLYFDELKNLVACEDWREPAPWNGLNDLTLKARIRSRHREDNTKLSCKLRSLTIAFSRHVKIPFGELSRILDGSRNTLTRLDFTEHQISTVDQTTLLESFGANLISIRTTSANQYSFSTIILPISTCCPKVKFLELGSYVKVEQALSSFTPLADLEEIKLKSVQASQYEPSGLFDKLADAVRLNISGWRSLRRIEVTENIGGYGSDTGGEARGKEVTYRMKMDRENALPSVEIIVKVFW